MRELANRSYLRTVFLTTVDEDIFAQTRSRPNCRSLYVSSNQATPVASTCTSQQLIAGDAAAAAAAISSFSNSRYAATLAARLPSHHIGVRPSACCMLGCYRHVSETDMLLNLCGSRVVASTGALIPPYGLT